MPQIISPTTIADQFDQGIQGGQQMRKIALDAAQIRASQQQLQEQMKPVKLEDFTKAVPDFLRPHVTALAESQGLVEKNGDMQYIRGGNAKAFIDQFKNNKVWQATVYDQANNELQAQLSPMQAQYNAHKERWTNLMQNYKDQYEQAVDEQGRPDQIKRNKIEAQIKKEQQENQDFVNMNKLEKQISVLSGNRMKALQVLGVIDEGFKRDEAKYGPEDAIRLNTGLVTRQQLEEQRERMEQRAKWEEVRATEQLKAGLKKEKSIERTIDLGDRVKTIYTDGTSSYEKKGETPSKQATSAGAEDIETMAKLLAEGKMNISDISKRGNIMPKVVKRAWELNPSLDPQATSAENAAFRSATQFLEKQRASMGSFVKNMDYQIGRVKEIAKDIKSFDSRLLNVPRRAFLAKVQGSANQAKYDMYLTEIENEIGKLSTGSAASISELSVGAQQKWEKIHDKNLSINDMLSLLEETNKAGKMRLQSVETQLSETKRVHRESHSGKTDTPERVTVVSPTGKKGTIPASQLNDALKQGYKRF